MTGVLHRSRITTVEITMDSPEAVTSIERGLGDDAVIGVGTVMSVVDAEAAVAAGVEFHVSPDTDLDVVLLATERGIPTIPSALIPSEAATARSAGAAAVRILPASVGGPGLLKALRGPVGDPPLVPTGGITGSNAWAFLAAGAFDAGVGGWLTDHHDRAIVGRRAGAVVDACHP